LYAALANTVTRCHITLCTVHKRDPVPSGSSSTLEKITRTRRVEGGGVRGDWVEGAIEQCTLDSISLKARYILGKGGGPNRRGLIKVCASKVSFILPAYARPRKFNKKLACPRRAKRGTVEVNNTTLIDIAPYETSLDPVLGYVSEHGTKDNLRD
jgi:hypothetical protein